MYDKNFKAVLSEWKNFLNETASIEKIYRQIEKLELINKSSKLDNKIKIQKESNDKFVIGYMSSEKDMYATHNYYLNSLQNSLPELEPPIYGYIEIISTKRMLASDYDDPEIEVPGKGVGETNSTWYIRKTHDTKKGHGPLLYEVVIEFVSTYLNACIKPDPSSVSEEAITVWEKYLQRSDVIAKQLDINPDDINYYKKEYPDQFEDEGHRKLKPLTPQTSDDTSQFSAMDHMGYMWPESPLSKSYRKNSANIIKLLKEKDLIIIDI
jgi:hypothetical protein